LKADWFQPLSLSSEKPVSKVAFKCNLYRYFVVPFIIPHLAPTITYAELQLSGVGGCTALIQLTHSLKATWFWF
jgi:hypothetical protein